ncbi:MAG: DUF1925 domain-containing protein, partial [Sheuella sp.]|nr:DUF1925 domain-containing protein [Sheuella sp.]
MSPHITLLMALHCHQPVGNFGWVIREAFERAYRPFLECVERHPSVKVSLHYTGCLIDWLEREEPQFLGRVAQLVAAGQVEMIGGGYYEPILPLIPERDRQAQLQQLSEKITALCGQRPCGAWLAERVWEPQVAGTLASAGFDYTIVDDTHIRAALGWSPQLKAQEDIFGFYLTEDEGRYLRLFPSSKRLRYWMPFHPVQETIQFLRGCPSGSIVTFADDGEKFGLWPGTHRWVYEEGWLEQFFTALEAESSWLHTSLFRECATTQPPAGRVYLPCTSYEEMTEWSGGHFRNFLVKYPESNWMHKRMLEVSRRVQALEDRPPRAATRVQHVAAARDALHHAQCNCAYWHGVFGGLYLQHLRHGIYQHLIAAEQHLEAAETAHTGGLVTSLDIDGDGLLETKLTTPALQLVVAPCRGAAVVECDVRSVGINLGNTLMRQPESYHAALVKAKTQHATVGGEQPKSIHDLLGAKESGLESFLLYDRHPRWSALDHLLAERPSVEQVTRSETTELIDPLGLYRCQPEPARRGVTAAA